MERKTTMQCPKCGFHNLPGTAGCVSCRAPLAETRTRVDVALVTPPRAPAWRKTLTQWNRSLGLRARVPAWAQRHEFGQALAGLLPGLPQWKGGDPGMGLAFAGAWLVLMALAACFFGVATGIFFLGAAVSTHVMSALLPFRHALAPLPAGLRSGIALSAVGILLGTIYFPLQWSVAYFVVPLTLYPAIDSPELHSGDTVLVRLYHDPAYLPPVGRIVMFGRNLDRVLATPGDRLVKEDGVLKRNGKPVPAGEQPLIPANLPNGIDVTVPPGLILVWPSLNLYREWAPANGTNGLISPASLLGEVWMVYHPWARRRILTR